MKSPFTEAQLNEITTYQEKRGITRSAAVKACKKAWASAPVGNPLRMAVLCGATAGVGEWNDFLLGCITFAGWSSAGSTT